MMAGCRLVVAAALFGVCWGAPPEGCGCLSKDRVQELIKKSTRMTVAEVGSLRAVIITAQRLNNPVSQVGEDFGSHCAAWEDGACSNTSCAAGPGHTCGTKRECKALWPDYNFDNDQVRAREPGAAGALRSRVCRGRECAAGGGRAMLDAG